MVKLKIQYKCDFCKTSDEFWVDISYIYLEHFFEHIELAAREITKGQFFIVETGDPKVIERAGEDYIYFTFCKDCVNKFKDKVKYVKE